MVYAVIFFLGIALFAAAAIYDSVTARDRLMSLMIAGGTGCTVFGLVMSVAGLFSD